MSKLLFIIYRFIAQPLSLILIFTIGLLNKKIRHSLKVRTSKKYRPPYPVAAKNSNPIWIHCSSGEFEYAKPVLKEIKARDPKHKTLVTFFSPSHIKQIKACPDVDYCYPLPLDLPGATSSFIDYFKPKKILFSRTDLWPELLQQAQNKNIPTLLFSRTQKVPNFLASNFTAWIYNKLTAIDFVSLKDKENFNFITTKNQPQLMVNGDSRFDEVLRRQNYPSKLKPLNPTGFTVVLGSVWPEDLKAILTKDFTDFIKAEKINLIIAPHEYNPSFQSYLESFNIKSSHLYSKLHSWDGNLPLVIDQYGLLFELYKFANLSFVGGSFKKNVHSVMEPLAWGCPVAVGPFNKNNREAQDLKLKLIGRDTPMVSEIKNGQQLTELIKTIMAIDQDIAEVIKKEIKMKCGASIKIVDWALS